MEDSKFKSDLFILHWLKSEAGYLFCILFDGNKFLRARSFLQIYLVQHVCFLLLLYIFEHKNEHAFLRKTKVQSEQASNNNNNNNNRISLLNVYL